MQHKHTHKCKHKSTHSQILNSESFICIAIVTHDWGPSKYHVIACHLDLNGFITGIDFSFLKNIQF